MAHVIELFGAPGAGKSRLVRALDGRRVDGRRIIDARRLTRVPRDGLLGHLRYRDLTPAERRAALVARRHDWDELLELAVGAPMVLARSVDPLRALNAPGWLVTTLELRALADAAPDDVIVVLDEGLAQRTSIVCGPVPDDESLARYLGALPVTLLHLEVVAPIEVLLARVTGRGRTIDRHAGLDERALRASLVEDLQLAARCARTLSDLRARVATVTTDAGDPVDALLERIRAALP